MKILYIIGLILSISPLLAEEIDLDKLLNLKGARVTSIKASGVTVMHSNGIKRIKYCDMPNELLKRFDFFPQDSGKLGHMISETSVFDDQGKRIGTVKGCIYYVIIDGDDKWVRINPLMSPVRGRNGKFINGNCLTFCKVLKKTISATPMHKKSKEDAVSELPVVSSIDDVSITVGKRNFMLSNFVKVVVNGKKATIKDVKPGMQVMVTGKRVVAGKTKAESIYLAARIVAWDKKQVVKKSAD